MAKVVCSEAIARVADRSMQILGGMGMTRDTVVERIFRDIRAFRIYDGPSEVHRWALGARIVVGQDVACWERATPVALFCIDIA